MKEIENLRMNPINWPTKVIKGGERIPITGVDSVQVINEA